MKIFYNFTDDNILLGVNEDILSAVNGDILQQ